MFPQKKSVLSGCEREAHKSQQQGISGEHEARNMIAAKVFRSHRIERRGTICEQSANNRDLRREWKFYAGDKWANELVISKAAT